MYSLQLEDSRDDTPNLSRRLSRVIAHARHMDEGGRKRCSAEQEVRSTDGGVGLRSTGLLRRCRYAMYVIIGPRREAVRCWVTCHYSRRNYYSTLLVR